MADFVQNFAGWLVEEGLARHAGDSGNLPIVIPAPRQGTPSPDDLRERTPPIPASVVIGIERTGGVPSRPWQGFIRQPTFDITVRGDKTQDVEAVCEALRKKLGDNLIDFEMGEIHINEVMVSREPSFLPYPNTDSVSYRMGVRFWYFDE